MSKEKKPLKTKKLLPVALPRLVSAVDAARMTAKVKDEPYTVEIKRWAEAIAEGIISGCDAISTDRMPSRQARDELVNLGYTVTPQAHGGVCVSWAGAWQPWMSANAKDDSPPMGG